MKDSRTRYSSTEDLKTRHPHGYIPRRGGRDVRDGSLQSSNFATCFTLGGGKGKAHMMRSRRCLVFQVFYFLYFFISASYLALSLAARPSYFPLAVHLPHWAPSSLPTSGTFQSGWALTILTRSSLQKYMKADNGRLGALGSLTFLTFFLVSLAALALAGLAFLATFFSGDLAGLLAAFLAGLFAAFLAGDLALATAFLATLGILATTGTTVRRK